MNSSKVKQTIEKYLHEFKEKKAHTLADSEFLTQYYEFFQSFFKHEQLNSLTWEEIQKLGENIHAFQALALSRHNALGSQHHPVEHYRKVFTYLAHGDDELEKRILNVMKNPDYNLKGFGNSVWSEIIGQLFADQYLLFNYRDQFALKLLGIDPGYERGDTFADKYIKFTKIMRPVIEAYKTTVGRQTNVPVNLEVDQFFSYLYETYHTSYSEYMLSDQQLEWLMARFKERMPDFQDFTQPGEKLVKHETAYKRRALKRFKEEVGLETLKQWIEAGDGARALKELDRRLTTNMVQYNSWRSSIGREDDDESICVVLSAFIQAAEADELKPGNLKPIFQATREQGLKPSWDTLSVLLWAFNPQLYAPVKISYYRKLAQELKQELPKGRPTANSFCKVMEWMQSFYTALEPLDPVDWVDVQSFIWVVCPGSHEDLNKQASTPQENVSDSCGTWLIAPGENARYWDEWQRDGIIAIGWDELGDLMNYSSQEELKLAISKASNAENPYNDTLACFDFSRSMKPGDIVLVKQGSLSIIGIGCIESDYIYDPTRNQYHSIRKVKWLKTGNWELPADRRVAIKTLTEFTTYTEWLEWFYGYADIDVDKLLTVETLIESENTIDTVDGDPQFYWLYINPKIWDPSTMELGERQTYTALNERGNKRRIYKHFEAVKPGDFLIGYESSPKKAITSVFKVTKPLHDSGEGKCIEFELVEKVGEPIRLHTLLNDLSIRDCEAFRNSQGSLFSLTANEFEHIKSMIDEVVLDQEASERKDEQKERSRPYTLAELKKETYTTKQAAQQWVKALERKKQMIFYGPPGTGKTFVAQRLARHIIGGGDGFMQTVQFHPAYSYEDFIQGIRPQSEADNSISYPTVPGRFLEFCTKARRCNDRCVLIIDEINRANLAKVFGELMYLLEYRDASIPLAGGRDFQIPDNVRIIGTMNTADRSIALVDHALRRRFAFVPLYPDYNVLRQFHSGTGFHVDRLIQQLKRLNTEIDNRHYEVGITYFLRTDLTIQLPDIWQMEIEPYLEEYFFDQPEKLNQFQWDRVRQKLEEED